MVDGPRSARGNRVLTVHGSERKVLGPPGATGARRQDAGGAGQRHTRREPLRCPKEQHPGRGRGPRVWTPPVNVDSVYEITARELHLLQLRHQDVEAFQRRDYPLGMDYADWDPFRKTRQQMASSSIVATTQLAAPSTLWLREQKASTHSSNQRLRGRPKVKPDKTPTRDKKPTLQPIQCSGFSTKGKGDPTEVL